METMDVRLHEPDRPLDIVVTDAGSEILRLRLLAKDAISMLLCPEAHSYFQREQVARGFQDILEDRESQDGDCLSREGESDFSESDEENEDEEEYEPGECVKWSDWPDMEDEF